ncbi:AmpG family muropeptide MFS transporter [Methylococcus mesophilus]|uniref:AmpG family muropeptide MFS transporter n=1 Tax=Methylococcus mesophilus TaxID=2993564 RepID=UPI00224B036C|nr:AmpG family muropeptide MFS transporter [Methylococcus mesophilus]UZR27905.1 AmpG family muropeptide MFS transporter [Methylococcus mesophilus]
MTSPSEPVVRSILSGRMLAAFAMGFYGGAPLLLTGSVLLAWMKDRGIDLTTIGLFALVGLPYTLKFLWAPVFDRFHWPRLGRRRGWLLLMQLLLAVAIASLAVYGPGASALMLAGLALAVAFFSASQDTLIDAYRRESLHDREQGLGASLYVNGYRLGMLLASGGGLILADWIGFPDMYGLMAIVMASGIMVTLLLPEAAAGEAHPNSLKDAVVLPFVEFFRRSEAMWVLLFILLYKLGDTVAGQMTTPFYLEMGFSKTEIGAVVKLFGFWATVLGGLAGGALILRYGIYRTLWQFGLLQLLSTAAFAVLVHTGPQLPALTAVISFENLSAGMGTAAFVAFMANQTDRRFTATQYALLSSLMGVPRVIAAAPSGWLATTVGWQNFFILCALFAIPGLLVLPRFRTWLAD